MVLLSSNTTKSPHQAHNKISRRRGRRRQLQHVTLRLQGLSGWRVAGPGRAYFRKMAQITGLRTASLPFLEGDVTELCCRFVNYPGTTIISPTALRLLPAPFVLLLSSAESSRQWGRRVLGGRMQRILGITSCIFGQKVARTWRHVTISWYQSNVLAHGACAQRETKKRKS